MDIKTLSEAKTNILSGLTAALAHVSKAKFMIEVNVLEDPLYHPADNRLG